MGRQGQAAQLRADAATSPFAAILAAAGAIKLMLRTTVG